MCLLCVCVCLWVCRGESWTQCSVFYFIFCCFVELHYVILCFCFIRQGLSLNSKPAEFFGQWTSGLFLSLPQPRPHQAPEIQAPSTLLVYTWMLESKLTSSPYMAGAVITEPYPSFKFLKHDFIWNIIKILFPSLSSLKPLPCFPNSQIHTTFSFIILLHIWVFVCTNIYINTTFWIYVVCIWLLD